MRDSLQLNESLKLELSKSRAQCITNPDVVAKKLHGAEWELHQELELQQQQHQV